MHGYHAGDNTVAFYPLHPLLARLVSFPLGGHIVLAEIIASTIAFGVAAWQQVQLHTDNNDWHPSVPRGKPGNVPACPRYA